MRTLLEIYFGINLFIIGLGIDIKDKKNYLVWYNVILFLLFGIFIIAGIYIYDYWITPLVVVFQIKFFYQLYFTNKWTDCSLIVLENINKWRKEAKSQSIKDCIYRYATGLLFKRNNFNSDTNKYITINKINKL